LLLFWGGDPAGEKFRREDSPLDIVGKETVWGGETSSQVSSSNSGRLWIELWFETGEEKKGQQKKEVRREPKKNNKER